ncbi:hypothetical protein ACWCXH_13020 [Kitasatospora sp. NPDC001660]
MAENIEPVVGEDGWDGAKGADWSEGADWAGGAEVEAHGEDGWGGARGADRAEGVDGADGAEGAEVEAHAANVLDLQAMKMLHEASDGSCFSLISYVHGAETSA